MVPSFPAAVFGLVACKLTFGAPFRDLETAHALPRLWTAVVLRVATGPLSFWILLVVVRQLMGLPE